MTGSVTWWLGTAANAAQVIALGVALWIGIVQLRDISKSQRRIAAELARRAVLAVGFGAITDSERVRIQETTIQKPDPILPFTIPIAIENIGELTADNVVMNLLLPPGLGYAPSPQSDDKKQLEPGGFTRVMRTQMDSLNPGGLTNWVVGLECARPQSFDLIVSTSFRNAREQSTLLRLRIEDAQPPRPD